MRRACQAGPRRTKQRPLHAHTRGSCSREGPRNALAGRIAHDSLHGGGVTLNGEPLLGRRLHAISAYAKQDDRLYPMLTVREMLLFATEVCQLGLARASTPSSRAASPTSSA